MLPPGHIATALVLSRLARAEEPPAVVGSLTPDFIDKPLAWVLHVIPGSRYLAHTLAAALLLSSVVGLLLGRRTAAGFAVGYLGHLAGDQAFGGHVPWLMPFRKYDITQDSLRDVRLGGWAWAFEALSLLLVVAWSKRALSGAHSQEPAP